MGLAGRNVVRVVATLFLIFSIAAHADTATHTFDANGRLYQVIGPNWTTTYTYDGAGNVTNVVKTAAQLSLLSATSRKTHGTAGNFDMPIAAGVPITGSVTVEARAIGAGHTIVFKFNSPVVNPGIAIGYDVSGSQIGSATTQASGNEVRVTFTGTLNTKRVRMDLSGVNGTATVHSITMGFLYGDADNTGAVTGGDISMIRGRAGQTTNSGNYTSDLNASGAIEAADISIVRGQSGMTLE